MREIKFRFYSDILGRFVVPDDGIFIGALKDEHMHPMQYTGLKDKNGVEIFEGDSADIRYEGGGHTKDMFTPCVVTYGTINLSSDFGDEYTPGFEFVQHGGPNSFAFDNLYGKVEVIGNVYENPELMA